MAGDFVGTRGRANFRPDEDGTADVEIDGAVFYITGLQPLPEGVVYNLVITAYDPNAVPDYLGEGPEGHDPTSGGGDGTDHEAGANR